MKLKIVVTVISATIISHASGVRTEGSSTSNTCAHAFNNALRNAAESAVGLFPQSIASMTTIRNGILISDEVISKSNYYVKSYSVDSVKNAFGCSAHVTATFDSSELQPLITKFNNWNDKPIGEVYSKETVESLRNRMHQDAKFISLYVQRNFRSALDYESEVKQYVKGSQLFEDQKITIKTNENFNTFVRNSRILIDEFMTKYQVVAKIEFNINAFDKDDGDYKMLFEIGNQLYLGEGIHLTNEDSLLNSGFEYSHSKTYQIDSVGKQPSRGLAYDLRINFGGDAYSENHEEYNQEQKVRDFNAKFDGVFDGNESMPISRYGVDYDFNSANDSVCYVMTNRHGNLIVWCLSYNEAYSYVYPDGDDDRSYTESAQLIGYINERKTRNFLEKKLAKTHKSKSK